MVMELIGAELDAAVADAEGVYWFYGQGGDLLTHGDDGPGSMKSYSPSTDWIQGGPIIERERIEISPWVSDGRWSALIDTGPDRKIIEGPTPLIAAMRAFVASKT